MCGRASLRERHGGAALDAKAGAKGLRGDARLLRGLAPRGPGHRPYLDAEPQAVRVPLISWKARAARAAFLREGRWGASSPFVRPPLPNKPCQEISSVVAVDFGHTLDSPTNDSGIQMEPAPFERLSRGAGRGGGEIAAAGLCVCRGHGDLMQPPEG